MTQQLERGRVVYFLGAGASKSICPWLPVASELTLESLTDPQSYSNDVPPTASEFQPLEKFLNSLPDGADLRRRPLEETLDRLKSVSQEIYGIALYCLGMRLSVRNFGFNDVVLSGVARWLTAVREKRDTIITTNYDTLPEVALSLMGTGEYSPNDGVDRDSLHWLDYGISRQNVHVYFNDPRWQTPPERSVLILKLHGSISWLFCEDCRYYYLDPIWQNAWDALAWPQAYGPCPKCKKKDAARRPVVVPPLPRKEYKDDAIKEIWERAENVLFRAEEIIFAGFSLSPTDSGVRDLLTRALQRAKTKRVTIIDRNRSAIEQNYRHLYGDLAQFAAETDWKCFLDNRFR